MTPADKPKNL